MLIFRNLTEQRLKEANRIHSMKLESIGVLAAGIAHEINTPIQFIGSNLAFLQESFQALLDLVAAYGQLRQAIPAESAQLQANLEAIDQLEEATDIEYLQEEGPKAFDQTRQGVDRVTRQVLGLKGFAHAGDSDSQRSADINEIIANALIVCQNAYKYVAQVELDLVELPAIKVFPGDIGQVIVNLMVNAAQAIEEQQGGNDQLGTIRIQSSCEGDWVEIRISDTGGGIPESARQRIFDPFFTTKEVGKGSGQGLAISRKIIHEKHHGQLSFASILGKGTTFLIRLPKIMA